MPSIALDCSAAKLPSLEGQPLADEGYELTVTGDGIVIRGVAAAGVFYGVQSLLQLLPAAREPATAAITVPGITVRTDLQAGLTCRWRGANRVWCRWVLRCSCLAVLQRGIQAWHCQVVRAMPGHACSCNV